jgi:hydroxyethylthiazole kinase-like uncharacterized protein yjeF
MSEAASTTLRLVLPGEAAAWLHGVAESRAVEAEALAAHAPHELMERAGLAVARLALAVAPHARCIWVACGPGNNGGDGLVAARHLQQAGKTLRVTLHGDAQRLPGDASHALHLARQQGIEPSLAPPDGPVDLVIDALLGLGTSRAPQGAIASALEHILQLQAPVLAVDLPSGLDAETGRPLGANAVRAAHTLSLLTLKPGLFTAAGRDHCGQVWLDSLGFVPGPGSASARLCSAAALLALPPRPHAAHKGIFGDVVVVGGAPGMTGAALLAGRAALAAGAGRVYVSLLDADGPRFDATRPELMFRPNGWRADLAALARSTVVCGCGAADAAREALPVLLARCPRLVLDADALNAIAADPALQRLLEARGLRGQATVLTPHPLEAARLLGCDAAAVQADRMTAARALSQRLRCVLLLKGSGSILVSEDALPAINPSGNALLATGGTGDVLAGWVGGLWAQMAPQLGDLRAASAAAEAAAWLHGRAADAELESAPGSLAMRADDLAERMRKMAALHRAAASV